MIIESVSFCDLHTLKDSRSQVLYACRPGLRMPQRFEKKSEFGEGLENGICKRPGIRMNEYTILCNVLKVQAIIPEEDVK